MKFTNVAKPGVMISQIAPPRYAAEGEVTRVFEMAVGCGVYECFQTLHIPLAEDRRRVAEIMQDCGGMLTSTVARIMNQQGLNLATSDHALRKKSVNAVRRCFDEAREAGTVYFGLLSGPAPADPTERAGCLDALTDSLLELAPEASDMTLVIEPLDVDRHKKAALGYTNEAVHVVETVRRTAPNVSLCLDTSHMLLNGEDCMDSLEKARDVTSEFHFCNVCLDPENEWFGDMHIPFGAPGILDMPQVVAMMKEGAESGFFHVATRPGFFFEILNRGQTVRDALAENMRVMKQALNAFEEL